MTRSTLLFSLGLGCCFASLFLVFTPQTAQNISIPAQNSKASLFLDTIPDESFDEPFDIKPRENARPDLFAERGDSSRVIPLVSIALDSTFVKLNKIPKDYSGYKIELMAVDTELPAEHDLFFQHGNLSMELVLPDSIYSYTLGQFEERPKAETFLYDLLIHRYPDARVVEYENGQRTY
jgi:hypothetical protein